MFYTFRDGATENAIRVSSQIKYFNCLLSIINQASRVNGSYQVYQKQHEVLKAGKQTNKQTRLLSKRQTCKHLSSHCKNLTAKTIELRIVVARMRSASLVKLIDLARRAVVRSVSAILTLKYQSKECECVSNTWQRRGGRLMQRAST
jgi:hypothetical protein